MTRGQWTSLLLVITLIVGGGWLMLERDYGNGRHGGGHGNRHRGGIAIAATPLSDPETKQASALYASKCSGCHGAQLEGSVGPTLIGVGSRYPLDKIERIAQFGKGKKKSVPMPSGLASSEEAMLLARWLATNPGLTGS